MRTLEPLEDEDTGPESCPGYLGQIDEGEFSGLNDVLKPLETINWADYADSIAEDAIWLNVGGVGRVEIVPTSSVGEILDQIPSLDVRRAPEYGYEIFFLRDDHSLENVAGEIAALVAAVRRDFYERTTTSAAERK